MKYGSLLVAGTHVRVHDGVPGWGEALDRYGVIEKVNLGAFKGVCSHPNEGRFRTHRRPHRRAR